MYYEGFYRRLRKELIEIYEQLQRLLDDYGTNGLSLVPNIILEEIAVRWHYSKTIGKLYKK